MFSDYSAAFGDSVSYHISYFFISAVMGCSLKTCFSLFLFFNKLQLSLFSKVWSDYISWPNEFGLTSSSCFFFVVVVVVCACWGGWINYLSFMVTTFYKGFIWFVNLFSNFISFNTDVWSTNVLWLCNTFL